MTTNLFRTISDITFKSADVLSNSLGFTSKVNRNYDDRFAKAGAKIGTVTNMRLPGQFQFSSGSAIDIQALSDRVMPLTLNKLYQRSFAVDSVDLTMSVDDFTERYTKPALINMANEIDYDGLQLALKYANNAVGGSAPNSTATFQALVGAARRKLSENLAPAGEPMYMIAPPTVNELGYTYLSTIFNPQNVIGEQYSSGIIARAGGFDWMESQLAPNYATGTYGGTPVTNGANQSGTSLVTDGWTVTTTTLPVGAVFTIDGVFAVNEQTKVSQGYLKQFTVTTATATDGAGNSTIQFSPAIVGPGSSAQNVSALPGDGKAIVVFGATGKDAVSSIAFHKNAFVFGTADLEEMRNGATSKVVSLPELGLSVRLSLQDDIRSNQLLMRCDLLGGWAPLYPQLSTKCVWA